MLKKYHKKIKTDINHCTLCGSKTAKGSGLIFVSCIKRDGSGTFDLSNTDTSNLNDVIFNLNCLSIKNKTYIACEFNCYVVKLKKTIKWVNLK